MTENQYASTPGNRAYSYAELAVSSLTIANTHYAYPRRDDQADLATMVAGYIRTEVVCPLEDGHQIPVLTGLSVE